MKNTPAIAVCLGYGKAFNDYCMHSENAHPTFTFTDKIWDYEHGVTNAQLLANRMQDLHSFSIHRIIIIQNKNGIPTEIAILRRGVDFVFDEDDFDSLPKYADDPEF